MMRLAIMTGAAIGILSTAAMAAGSASPWDGAYVGAQIGFGSAPWRDDRYGPDGYGGVASGLLAGGQLGYNWRLFGKVVGGLEADASWSNLSGTALLYWDPAFRLNWGASLRARIGYDFGGIMPFVTAGIAVARPQTAAVAYTRAGFTAGAGAEFVLSERLTAKAEFRYSDFGSADYGYILHVTDGTVRAGLNYHFQ